jgi:hypothetical protein
MIMLKITKNIMLYCFNYNKKLWGVIISSLKGWGIIKYKNIVSLIKSKKVCLFPFYNESIFDSFNSFIFGFQKGYFQYLSLKGVGYKFTVINNILATKLGYSHRILFITKLNIRCNYVTKYLLKINSRNLKKLIKVSFFFFKSRKQSIYNKKGIFIKGSIFKIKLSSKKLKY